MVGEKVIPSKRIIIILFIPIHFSPKSSTQIKRLRNIHNIPKLRHTLKSDTDLQDFLSSMKVFYSKFLLFANSVVRKLLRVWSSRAFIVRSLCSIVGVWSLDIIQAMAWNQLSWNLCTIPSGNPSFLNPCPVSPPANMSVVGTREGSVQNFHN